MHAAAHLHRVAALGEAERGVGNDTRRHRHLVRHRRVVLIIGTVDGPHRKRRAAVPAVAKVIKKLNTQAQNRRRRCERHERWRRPEWRRPCRGRLRWRWQGQGRQRGRHCRAEGRPQGRIDKAGSAAVARAERAAGPLAGGGAFCESGVQCRAQLGGSGLVKAVGAL